MKKQKQKLFTFSIVALALCGALFSFFGPDVRVREIERILRSEAYSYLPDSAKSLIRDNYLATDTTILTERNQILNQPYLNPAYVEYLELSQAERAEVDLIPDTFITPLSMDVITSSLTEAGPLPASFDLRDVDGHSYITPLKNQGGLGICWTYAAAEQAESYLLMNELGESDPAIILAPRQIDYSTSTNGIKNWTNAEFGTRKLTEGGSFLHAAQTMAAGLSFAPQEDSIYTAEGTTALPLEQVLSFDKTLYELNASTTFNQDSTTFGTATPSEADLAYRTLIKQHIMQYGGASIGTEGPQNQCGNVKGDNGSYFVRVDDACTKGNGHAMQIIGWDDTFDYTYCNVDGVHKYGKGCLGQPEITTTGDTPNAQRGAWLVRNSWGDASEFSYLYVTYDSLGSSIDIITNLTSSSEKTWDNEYSNTYLIAKEDDTFSYSVANGEALDFTKKTDKEEKLTQIKFYALSADTTYYIVNTDSDNFFIKEFPIALPGYQTVDLSSHDVHIQSSEDFGNIRIYGFNPYVGSDIDTDAKVLHGAAIAFTENLNDDPAIYGTVDTVTPVEADKKITFTIAYDTANIPSGESLSFHLIGSKNTDPENPVAPSFEVLNTAESNTYNFTATDTHIAYNKANVNFSMADNLKKGVYSVVAYYGTDPLTEEGADTPYVVTYFAKDDAKGEIKYALATADSGTLSVEKETINLLTGKRYEGEGPSAYLSDNDIAGTKFTPADGYEVKNWTVAKTYADYAKEEEIPAGAIVGSGNEFIPPVIDSKFFAVYAPATYYVNAGEATAVYTFKTEMTDFGDWSDDSTSIIITGEGLNSDAGVYTSAPVAVKTGTAKSVTTSIDAPAGEAIYYAFDGWYDTDDNLISTNPEFTPAKVGEVYVATTYTAKWHAMSGTLKVTAAPEGYGTTNYTAVAFPLAQLKQWKDAITTTDTTIQDPAGTDITATPATATAQYTYSFDGWTLPTIDATDNLEYTITAGFTATTNAYKITFKNYDDTILQESDVDYGTTPVYGGQTPIRVEDDTYTYAFTGWDSTIAPVTGIATYKATFTPVYKNYTIRFYDGATLLSEKTDYHYGDTIILPTAPTKEADVENTYAFAGWTTDGETILDLTTVSGSIDYHALFTATKNKYTVTFKNYDGTVLQTEDLEYGTLPTYQGSTPERAADNTYTYTFKGWDIDIATVEGEITYTATFTPVYKNYRIRFIVEGTTVIDKTDYHYGETILPPLGTPTKPATAQYTYTFSGWSPAVATVTGDQDYTATFSSTVNSYTVTFKNYDGTVLQTEDLDYGALPEYRGTTPTKEADNTFTYTFLDWDAEIDTVTAAATYTATFTSHYKNYTIKFYSEDTLISEKTDYHYGDTIVAPSDPEKAADETYTYTFAGWTPSVPSTVAGDATFTASFEPVYIDYTIRFQDYDENTISETTYHYGETVTVPTDPTRAADADHLYFFAGWDETITTVSGNHTYTATYDVVPLAPTSFWIDDISEYVFDTSESLDAHINIALDYFTHTVTVDGVELTEEVDYITREGSTVISLAPEFLNTLEPGKHVMTVSFIENITATIEFTISEPTPDVPNTGHETTISEFVTPLLLPLFAILTVVSITFAVLKQKR